MNFDEFRDSILKQARKEGVVVPLYVSWDLTNRCNLTCRHCYNAGNCSEDLSIDATFRIVDSLVEMGTLELTLSGGEPLLFPGFEKLLERIKECRFRVHLLSNGTLFGPRQIDILKTYLDENDSIQVSYDSVSEEMSSQRLLSPQQRAILKQGVNVLREAGLDVYANVTPTCHNLGELLDVVTDAANMAFKGVSMTPFARLPSMSGNHSPDFERLADLEPQVIGILKAKGIEYYGGMRGAICQRPSYEGRPRTMIDKHWMTRFPCDAGQYQFHICSNGNLFPCVFAQHESLCAGNIAIEGQSVWNNGKWDLFRGKRNMTQTRCVSCERFAECRGGCPGITIAWNDTVNAPDPRCHLED